MRPLVFVLLVVTTTICAETLEFDSVYNYVRVERTGTQVTFRYKYKGARMSAIDLSNEAFQVVPYTRYLFSPLFIKEDPENTLLIGLGAGSYNRLHRLVFPNASLTSVEIDSMIVRLAIQYANFNEQPDNNVDVDDARMYLKKNRQKWDWILLDAFDVESQIPMHLSTVEFYQILSERMNEDGVMATNLQRGKPILYAQIATLRQVFPQVIVFYVPYIANVIALCSKDKSVDLYSIVNEKNLDDLPNLKRYGIDFGEMQAQVEAADYVLAGENPIILTDDYAPVEILSR